MKTTCASILYDQVCLRHDVSSDNPSRREAIRVLSTIPCYNYGGHRLWDMEDGSALLAIHYGRVLGVKFMLPSSDLINWVRKGELKPRPLPDKGKWDEKALKLVDSIFIIS